MPPGHVGAHRPTLLGYMKVVASGWYGLRADDFLLSLALIGLVDMVGIAVAWSPPRCLREWPAGRRAGDARHGRGRTCIGGSRRHLDAHHCWARRPRHVRRSRAPRAAQGAQVISKWVIVSAGWPRCCGGFMRGTQIEQHGCSDRYFGDLHSACRPVTAICYGRPDRLCAGTPCSVGLRLSSSRRLSSGGARPRLDTEHGAHAVHLRGRLLYCGDANRTQDGC